MGIFTFIPWAKVSGELEEKGAGLWELNVPICVPICG